MALFSGYWRRSELMHLIHKTRQKQELPMAPCFLTDRNTTKVVSLNPSHGEVYSIQHYVIKFVSDLQQVCGFLLVLPFLPPIKRTANATFNNISPIS
jgi:hypothetical protein